MDLFDLLSSVDVDQLQKDNQASREMLNYVKTGMQDSGLVTDKSKITDANSASCSPAEPPAK